MALVISAGGDHSAYVLGMLHQLFVIDAKFDWDFLAGNSAGALICCGVCKSTNEHEYIKMITTMFESMCKKDAVQEWSRFGSFINIITSIFFHKSIYRTTLPDMVRAEFGDKMPCRRTLHIGVYNQTHGKYETIVGYSPDTVAASCSIPGIFEPVVINGCQYVDGGMGHIIPTPAIKEFCLQKDAHELDIMCCYPICSFEEFHKTEYACSTIGLMNEGLETFICLLWNNLQRDLDELSIFFGIDVRKTRIFQSNNINVRLFAPNIGIYSSFTHKNPTALRRMFCHGKEIAIQMYNTKKNMKLNIN